MDYGYDSILLWVRGEIYFGRVDDDGYESDSSDTRAVFGGQICEVENQADYEFADLHQVLRIPGDHESLRDYFDLSLPHIDLIYGFKHDQCFCDYRILRNGNLKINSLSPRKASSHWPYHGYPGVFPRKLVALTHAGTAGLSEVEEYCCDGTLGDRGYPIDFVAIVPESDTYGVGLWSADIDQPECVVLQFCGNLSKGIVEVRNGFENALAVYGYEIGEDI